MSHGDQVTELPPGFRALAHSDNSPFAAMGDDTGLFGIQFHPEVVHTPQGSGVLRELPLQRLRLPRRLDGRQLHRRRRRPHPRSRSATAA